MAIIILIWFLSLLTRYYSCYLFKRKSNPQKGKKVIGFLNILFVVFAPSFPDRVLARSFSGFMS